MKTKNIFLGMATMACLLCSACMDGDWDAPASQKPPYGNNDIDTTGVVSIAMLKAAYPKNADNYTCTKMNQGQKLRVYVTGNDIQGNLYNSIAVQDEAGDALIVAISENSLFGYLPVGQEIIIDTYGLYIGGYGSQPQIGMPYTNANGSTYVSRMSSSVWAEHVRILPTKHKVEPVEFNPNMDIAKNCGKLMVIKNVEINGADGKMTWAPAKEASNNAVARYLKGQSKNIEVYTSSYSDFANAVIPTGKVNLTGIWKRYNNYWEIILRSESDCQKVQ